MAPVRHGDFSNQVMATQHIGSSSQVAAVTAAAIPNTPQEGLCFGCGNKRTLGKTGAKKKKKSCNLAPCLCPWCKNEKFWVKECQSTFGMDSKPLNSPGTTPSLRTKREINPDNQKQWTRLKSSIQSFRGSNRTWCKGIKSRNFMDKTLLRGWTSYWPYTLRSIPWESF